MVGLKEDPNATVDACDVELNTDYGRIERLAKMEAL